MGKSLSKPTDLRTYVKSRMLWEVSISKLSLPAARWEAETQESLRSLGVSYHIQWRKQQERPCLKMRWKTKTDRKLSSDCYWHHGVRMRTTQARRSK